MIPDELQPQNLLWTYCLGAFPMADQHGHLSWYSPDPRAIIELDQFQIPRSLRQRMKKGNYEIRINTCFEMVIGHCADRREGTWISPEIREAYIELHRLGAAHSVETFYGERLAGGLYGVSLGGVFWGESMFTLEADGSKLALVALIERLRSRGLILLDTQFVTPHLERFGTAEIPRREYLQRLKNALQIDTHFVDPPEIVPG